MRFCVAWGRSRQLRPELFRGREAAFDVGLDYVGDSAREVASGVDDTHMNAG